jgi:hypothetical protein
MSLAIAHSKAIEAMQSSLENWSFLLGKSFCFNSHLPFLHGVDLSSPPHSSSLSFAWYDCSARCLVTTRLTTAAKGQRFLSTRLMTASKGHLPQDASR